MPFLEHEQRPRIAGQLDADVEKLLDDGLWATRWRRPSAAANPQGFCWPATPALTHFVAVVMLILIDCPSMKIGREQSSLGLRCRRSFQGCGRGGSAGRVAHRSAARTRTRRST